MYCDGINQCQGGEDEMFCHILCPPGCLCHGLLWKCLLLPLNSHFSLPLGLVLRNENEDEFQYMTNPFSKMRPTLLHTEIQRVTSTKSTPSYIE